MTLRMSQVLATSGDHKKVTAMLTVTATGKKLPAMVFLNLKRTPPALKGKKLPQNVRVGLSDSTMMSRANMKSWCEQVLDGGQLFAERKQTRASRFCSDRCCAGVLILDSYAVHLTDEVKGMLHRRNIQPVYVPGGYTPLLQPLDACVNKSFKCALRAEYEQWLGSDASSHLTSTGRLKRVDYYTLVMWISRAWASIDCAIVSRSFDACGVGVHGASTDQLHSRLQVPARIHPSIVQAVFTDGLSTSNEITADCAESTGAGEKNNDVEPCNCTDIHENSECLDDDDADKTDENIDCLEDDDADEIDDARLFDALAKVTINE